MPQRGLWPPTKGRDARERFYDGHGRVKVEVLSSLEGALVDLSEALEALCERVERMESRLALGEALAALPTPAKSKKEA